MSEATIKGLSAILPVKDLRPNPWNPNTQSDFMFNRERESIRRFGFLDPVTVRIAEDGLFEIVDGEHRWKAAQLEGLTDIPVWNLGALSRTDAMALTDILNNLQGTSDPILQAQMLTELLASVPSMADVLPYTPEQITQFEALATFEFGAADEEHHDDGGQVDGRVTKRFRLTPDEELELSAALEAICSKLGTKDEVAALLHLVRAGLSAQSSSTSPPEASPPADGSARASSAPRAPE